MASVYEPHRITVDEYHRMVAADVFDPDARLELIEGELVEMPPIYPPHASAVDRILNAFAAHFVARAWIRCQNPVTLRPTSEPQPDLVLARLVPGAYREHHPEPPEILLAVEVAQSSLYADRKIKVPLYARSGISELWLVNLVDAEVVVYRDPGAAWYASVRSYCPGESIAPIAFPDTALAVRDLLPPQE